MPIYSGNPIELTDPRQVATEATFGEAFRASTYTMYEGLLGSMARDQEIQQAEGTAGIQQFGRAAASRESVNGRAARPLSPLLDPEMARQQLRDNGLEQNLSIPANGIRQATLDILMSRKRDELRRNQIMSESVGIGGLTANLAGALAGSFVDPTNIALAFVPVVGEARYGQLLARAGGAFGRTGVRAGVGSAEGLVGLAPVEVLNYYAHQQQQSDYDAYDSMTAIAGGAFFGSALHAGGGLFSDFVLGGARRYTPAVVRNEPSLAGIVDAPGAAAPPVLDMAARERLMVLDRLAEGRPVTRAQVEARVTGTKVSAPDGRPILVFHGTKKEFDVFDTTGGSTPGAWFSTDKAGASAFGNVKEVYLDIKNPASAAELNIARREVAAAGFDPMVDARAANEAVIKNLEAKGFDGIHQKDFKGAGGKEVWAAFRPEQIVEPAKWSPALRKELDADPFMPVRPFIAGLDQTTQAGALRMAIAQAVSGRPVDISPALYADEAYFNPESGFAAANRNADMVDGADVEASKWADSIKPLDDDIETARTQVADEEAFVNEMMDAAGIEMTEPFKRSINDAVLESKKQSAAARSAAMCMMRTGG